MDLVRFQNNIKRMINCFKDIKYVYNESAPVLSREQYAAINIGAINSEQNGYYCNCIETEPDKEDVAGRLSDYYGIYDSESALETLEWLLHRGHNVYFEAIRPVIANSAQEFNVDILLEEEKDRSLMAYVGNIKASLEVLVDEHIVKGASEFKTISVKAWDLGRLVLVTRCCCDVGYITEEQAWQYIMAVYECARKLYHNWNEFAQGYIVGRAMWKGNDGSLYGIISIAQGLLNDDNSPWTKYLLH